MADALQGCRVPHRPVAGIDVGEAATATEAADAGHPVIDVAQPGGPGTDLGLVDRVDRGEGAHSNTGIEGFFDSIDIMIAVGPAGRPAAGELQRGPASDARKLPGAVGK